MSAPADDRTINDLLARRASPELAAEFAEAVRDCFKLFGWLPIGAGNGDFAAVPPTRDDVVAIFHADSGGSVELRVGATELIADGTELVARLASLAAVGCGRLPDSALETRRLLTLAVARFAGLPTDGDSLDKYADHPAMRWPIDELLAGIEAMGYRFLD